MDARKAYVIFSFISDFCQQGLIKDYISEFTFVISRALNSVVLNLPHNGQDSTKFKTVYSEGS
jgi:hypothetical protein